MQAQTLLLSREAFPQPSSAVAWARDHGFKALKVHTTGGFHRIRQRVPSKFVGGSMRTVQFSPMIKAIVGCPKR